MIYKFSALVDLYMTKGSNGNDDIDKDACRRVLDVLTAKTEEAGIININNISSQERINQIAEDYFDDTEEGRKLAGMYNEFVEFVRDKSVCPSSLDNLYKVEFMTPDEKKAAEAKAYAEVRDMVTGFCENGIRFNFTYRYGDLISRFENINAKFFSGDEDREYVIVDRHNTKVYLDEIYFAERV